MYAKLLILIEVSLCFSLFFSIVGAGLTVVLDTEKDLYIFWDLEGKYKYYQNGSSLSLIKDSLPKTFDYNAARDIQGIWAILPNDTIYRIDQPKSTALFKFLSASKLIASLDLTYWIGGNATIGVRTLSEPSKVLKIIPSQPMENKFVTKNIPLSPSSRFELEINAYGAQSFVLIDKIQANYLEAQEAIPTSDADILNIQPNTTIHCANDNNNRTENGSSSTTNTSNPISNTSNTATNTTKPASNTSNSNPSAPTNQQAPNNNTTSKPTTISVNNVPGLVAHVINLLF